MRRTLYLALAILVWASATLQACYWDTDTLAAERARFPEIAELITGVFPRHSREFHAWRILTSQDQIARNKVTPTTYDDLAVSLHKIGDHKAAIETMHEKEKVSPGLYETYSNLGTLHLYTDELDTAARYIRQALAINPNAHFGREKYQLWIIEWLQSRKNTPASELSEHDLHNLAFGSPHGFASFIARKLNPDDAAKPQNELTLSRAQQAEALRGILGMMWFADYDNPLLLEALGDVLMAGHFQTNASHLAKLSYLHASRRTTDPDTQVRLKALIKATTKLEPKGIEAPDLEKLLATGLAKGQVYVETIRQDEIAWMKAGLNPGLEFQKKYLKP